MKIHVAGVISQNQTVEKVMFFEDEADALNYKEYLVTKVATGTADWDINTFNPFCNSYPVIPKKGMDFIEMKKEDAMGKLTAEEKVLLGVK